MEPSYRSDVIATTSPSRVFQALTTLEGLAGWWTPLVTGDPGNAGGTIDLRFAGLTESIELEVLDVTPDRALTWRCARHTGHPEWENTTIEFAIEPIDTGRTRIAVRHHGLTPTLSCYDVCSRGWDHFLPSLVSFVDTGHGAPFTDQGQR